MEKPIPSYSSANATTACRSSRILKKDGTPGFAAFSAGVTPAPQVSPTALRILTDHRYPDVGFRCKAREEFLRPTSPPMDFIVSLCGASGVIGVTGWNGSPRLVEWRMDDPKDRDPTFQDYRLAFGQLRDAIGRLTALSRTAAFANATLRALQDLGTRV